jgi:hypothetical protein
VEQLVARRQHIMAELRRCRDAFGRVGYARSKRVPLPGDVDAIPEGAVPIAGRPLRQAAAALVVMAGRPVSVDDIHRMLLARGLNPEGRPSKAISDALRYEVTAGRLSRVARGVYGPPEP